MVPFRGFMHVQSLVYSPNLSIAFRWVCRCVLIMLILSTPVLAGIPIEQDPNGFYGIPWGTPLANRSDLQRIDASDSIQIYTIKKGNPHIEGISMESIKLYGIDDQYARALFYYRGAAIHHTLLEYLENRFGKRPTSPGKMMRGLNQQYTWRGPETEISLSYHSFRERGFLTVESRVLAPKFLDMHSDHSY